MSSTYLLGDCLDVMKTMADKSIDCFVCDLPYGCLAPKKSGTTTTYLGGCPWDVKIELSEFWKQIRRLAKSAHTPVLMFCDTRFGIDLIQSNPSWFRYDLVWDKGHGSNWLMVNKQPRRSHEMIYVFSEKASYYKRIDEPRNGSMQCVLSVVQCRRQPRKEHPTEKPQAIYKWLLERYCPPGGTYLDPTAGSFNSITVAPELGMHGIGIEKDVGFFTAAVGRSVERLQFQAVRSDSSDEEE